MIGRLYRFHAPSLDILNHLAYYTYGKLKKEWLKIRITKDVQFTYNGKKVNRQTELVDKSTKNSQLFSGFFILGRNWHVTQCGTCTDNNVWRHITQLASIYLITVIWSNASPSPFRTFVHREFLWIPGKKNRQKFLRFKGAIQPDYIGLRVVTCGTDLDK